MNRSHYPHFDVMAQQEHWDPHTRWVVNQRLQPSGPPKQLKEHEVQTLKAVLRHLLYEDREELLDFVVAHFDQRLGNSIGEGQRQPEVPPEAQLVRNGLALLDAVASHRHKKPFKGCAIQEQFHILASLQKGQLENTGPTAAVPQKPLFQKMLSLAVESYASHPTVWSEMGYAGPAYPRGYYRIEKGVTDPWEARRQPGAPAPTGPQARHHSGRNGTAPAAQDRSGKGGDR